MNAPDQPAACITITREQRNAIHAQVKSLMYEGDDLSIYFDRADAPCNREWIRELAWKLLVALRLLDQLGWHERGLHDTYRIEVDETLARFMVDVERHASGGLEDTRSDLISGRASAAKHAVVYTDEEWADEEASYRGLLDQDLDALSTARQARAAYSEAVA